MVSRSRTFPLFDTRIRWIYRHSRTVSNTRFVTDRLSFALQSSFLMCINAIFVTLTVEQRYHARSELFRSDFKLHFEVCRSKWRIFLQEDLSVVKGIAKESSGLRGSETEGEFIVTNQFVSATHRRWLPVDEHQTWIDPHCLGVSEKMPSPIRSVTCCLLLEIFPLALTTYSISWRIPHQNQSWRVLSIGWSAFEMIQEYGLFSFDSSDPYCDLDVQ